MEKFHGTSQDFSERDGRLAVGSPFPEMRGVLLHHMGVAEFSALFVAAPVAVTTKVEGIGNDNIHMYRMLMKREIFNLQFVYHKSGLNV